MLDVTLLRTVVIVLLALSAGGVFAVMRLHWRAWRKAPPGVGLTPLHVFLVSLGVLILDVTLAWGLMEGLTGTNQVAPAAVIRTVLYGVGSITVLAALLVVAKVQRRRIKFPEHGRTVTIEESDTVSVQVDGQK